MPQQAIVTSWEYTLFVRFLTPSPRNVYPSVMADAAPKLAFVEWAQTMMLTGDQGSFDADIDHAKRWLRTLH